MTYEQKEELFLKLSKEKEVSIEKVRESYKEMMLGTVWMPRNNYPDSIEKLERALRSWV